MLYRIIRVFSVLFFFGCAIGFAALTGAAIARDQLFPAFMLCLSTIAAAGLGITALGSCQNP